LISLFLVETHFECSFNFFLKWSNYIQNLIDTFKRVVDIFVINNIKTLKSRFWPLKYAKSRGTSEEQKLKWVVVDVVVVRVLRGYRSFNSKTEVDRLPNLGERKVDPYLKPKCDEIVILASILNDSNFIKQYFSFDNFLVQCFCEKYIS